MIEFITTNWSDIALAITSLIGTASVIVRITPTPKDNAILEKIIKVVGAIGLNPK